MPKPQSFNLTSDYGSLKADSDSQTVSLFVPGSIAIPPGNAFALSIDREIGTVGASVRSRAVGSKEPASDLIASARIFSRTGSLSGSPTAYTIDTWISRISATEIRLSLLIENNFGLPLTTEAGSETITYTLTTYKSPFS